MALAGPAAAGLELAEGVIAGVAAEHRGQASQQQLACARVEGAGLLVAHHGPHVAQVVTQLVVFQPQHAGIKTRAFHL